MWTDNRTDAQARTRTRTRKWKPTQTVPGHGLIIINNVFSVFTYYDIIVLALPTICRLVHDTTCLQIQYDSCECHIDLQEI